RPKCKRRFSIHSSARCRPATMADWGWVSISCGASWNSTTAEFAWRAAPATARRSWWSYRSAKRDFQRPGVGAGRFGGRGQAQELLLQAGAVARQHVDLDHLAARVDGQAQLDLAVVAALPEPRFDGAHERPRVAELARNERADHQARLLLLVL